MISPRRCRANHAAIAWLNAFIATGKEESRGVLFRSLSLEFFASGVQFIGCDGTMLFRTWCAYSDSTFLRISQPEAYELPDVQVVVSDTDKFAIGFMRALLSAVDPNSPTDLIFSIEPVEKRNEPGLGEELHSHVLVLSSLDQKLSCPLLRSDYPNWRKLQFGIDQAERVSGMVISTKIFAAVGKLRGVGGVALKFKGKDRVIEFTNLEDDAPIRGLLMPMRRQGKED